LLSEIRKIPQNVGVAHAAGEGVQHVIDGDAQSADAGFAAALTRLHGDDI